MMPYWGPSFVLCCCPGLPTSASALRRQSYGMGPRHSCHHGNPLRAKDQAEAGRHPKSTHSVHPVVESLSLFGCSLVVINLLTYVLYTLYPSPWLFLSLLRSPFPSLVSSNPLTISQPIHYCSGVNAHTSSARFFTGIQGTTCMLLTALPTGRISLHNC